MRCLGEDRSQTEVVAGDGGKVGNDVPSVESVQLELFRGFGERREGDLTKRGGEMVPGSPARERTEERNTDISQTRRRSSPFRFRCSAFMAIQVLPRAGGVNLVLGGGVSKREVEGRERWGRKGR